MSFDEFMGARYPEVGDINRATNTRLQAREDIMVAYEAGTRGGAAACEAQLAASDHSSDRRASAARDAGYNQPMIEIDEMHTDNRNLRMRNDRLDEEEQNARGGGPKVLKKGAAGHGRGKKRRRY